MGRKIFVSYKYADTDVQSLNTFGGTKVRDYVDVVSDMLAGDIFKGEYDGEDLSHLSEETIEAKLRERMFDSSMTIVLISKNMREAKEEHLQWVPREISYSLRVKTRGDKTSGTNAMLAVILPDSSGSYSYFVESRLCHSTSILTWKTETLFSILGKNMFNRKQPNTSRCSGFLCASTYVTGDDHSYIFPVTWEKFKANHNGYIDHAYAIKEKIDQYELTVNLSAVTSPDAVAHGLPKSW